MTTVVTTTGTGTPVASPTRAGAGALVRHGDLALQFDTGRNTLARLVAAGVKTDQLDAVFLTHYHSDHV
ncbi:MAG: MBL fold metallo-hydrolase, partial [Acidimicrobiia bacterium]